MHKYYTFSTYFHLEVSQEILSQKLFQAFNILVSETVILINLKTDHFSGIKDMNFIKKNEMLRFEILNF